MHNVEKAIKYLLTFSLDELEIIQSGFSHFISMKRMQEQRLFEKIGELKNDKKM